MAEAMLENMFLVEIRLGRTKWKIKQTTTEIGGIFRIEEFTEKHPHITLFGPFSLRKDISVPHLLKAIEIAAKPFGAIPFLIAGYDMNQGLNGAVIAYRIVPTDPLVELTEAMGAAMGELAETFNTWDMDLDQKWYHVTIANRLDRERAAQIFSHLVDQLPIPSDNQEKKTGLLDNLRLGLGSNRADIRNQPPGPPLLDEDGLRITVVNGEHILLEYDLLHHRWFSPHGEHAVLAWQDTLAQYRKTSGIERTRPNYTHDRDIFVICDLHLGHANIIRYCSRPFPHDAVDEMDQVLIRNWNFTIKPDDRIYHIGDLCYGPLAKNPLEYLQRLNGRVTLVQGNHDQGVKATIHSETIIHKGISFVLVHDPKDAPDPFDGWVIHGHHHNNDLKHYPFINFENRRINVSAEVVRYQPVSLTDLCNIIKDHQLKPKEKSILLRGM